MVEWRADRAESRYRLTHWLSTEVVSRSTKHLSRRKVINNRAIHPTEIHNENTTDHKIEEDTYMYTIRTRDTPSCKSPMDTFDTSMDRTVKRYDSD